jgi:RND superfamily putative drug exporter
MFDWVGRLAVNHPWRVVGAWIALAAAVSLAAPHWQSCAQDDDIRFLPERFPSLRGYHLLEQAFPHEVFASRAVFALERADGPLRPQDFALADAMVEELVRLREQNADLKIGKILSHKDGLIGGRLTSTDGRCTLIQVSLGTPYLAFQTQTTVDFAEERLRQVLKAGGRDVPRLYATGAAGVGRDLLRASGDSLDQTTLATIVLVVVILLLVYRAPLMALVPLLTIAVSVWVAVHLLALATLLPGVHLVTISRVFAIVILYGAGTDYCLFLISRYREELGGGVARAAALRRTVRAVGSALAASAGTVICGLSLMGFAEFAKVRCAGPAIAVALVVGLLAALTLTPALVRLLGGALFWPRKAAAAEPRFLGRLRGYDGSRATVGVGRWDAVWEWISGRVVARPLMVWLGSALLLAPLAFIGLQVVPTYRPTGELSPQSASIRGMKAIQKHFTAGETGPLTLLLTAAADWDTPEGKEQIAQVSTAIAGLDNVAEVRSLTQPLGKPLPVAGAAGSSSTLLGGLVKALGRDVSSAVDEATHAAHDFYVSTAGPQHVTRLDVVLRSDPFDGASIATLGTIEKWLAEELPRSQLPMGWVESALYGPTVHSRDLAVVTESDRRRVNLLVLGGIFLILLVLIRSLWLAGYLLLTVLFSYFATLGATTLFTMLCFGQPLGQLDWRVPFFLFTILIAVGEDYNILLVTRILQERRTHGNEGGTQRGLSRTGGAITACGLIMAGTFATLMLAGLNTLVAIGFALAFGVLIDTFIVRPFLVPTLMLLVWRASGRTEPEEAEAGDELRRSA